MQQCPRNSLKQLVTLSRFGIDIIFLWPWESKRILFCRFQDNETFLEINLVPSVAKWDGNAHENSLPWISCKIVGERDKPNIPSSRQKSHGQKTRLFGIVFARSKVENCTKYTILEIYLIKGVDKWYGDRWSHLCPKKWLFYTNFSQGLSSKVGIFLIFLANFTSWLFWQNVGSFKQEIHLCPYFWLFWLLYFYNFVQILFERSHF